jgi:hypothetical protein
MIIKRLHRATTRLQGVGVIRLWEPKEIFVDCSVFLAQKALLITQKKYSENGRGFASRIALGKGYTLPYFELKFFGSTRRNFQHVSCRGGRSESRWVRGGRNIVLNVNDGPRPVDPYDIDRKIHVWHPKWIVGISRKPKKHAMPFWEAPSS